jgi:DNA-binding NarL/FixJ family response regulator
MKAPKKPLIYSAEQNKMLTDCLFALRANWLSHVEAHLAHREHDNSDERVVALTNRERQIAALVGRGLANKEIARQLGLSGGTVKCHTHNIYQKFGVKTRAELIYTLSRR